MINRPSSSFLAPLAALLVLALSGCPVGGKRKKRVERDERGARVDRDECRCPPGIQDEARRRLVVERLLSGTPRRGGVLRIHTEVDPPSLNPVLKPDAWVVRIVLHDVLEALVFRDPQTGRFRGELAQGWTRDDSGTRWVFTLRPDVTWHDGRPFTAADVIHTLDMVMAPDSTAVSVKASLEEMTRWEVTGEREVTLELSRPNSLFLQHLEGLPILPKHLYVKTNLDDHPANRAPVGTGPFRFVHWTPGKEIVIARNDGYRGAAPWLDEVRYVIVKDRNVAFQMLQRGDIDLMPRTNADQYLEYERNESLERRFFRIAHDTPDISFLMYNTRDELFDSPEVRRAMTMLLDRPRIRCAVHRCLARIISGPWPLGHPANDPAVEPWPFDPDRAAELLASRGFADRDGDGWLDRDGRPFRFTFIVPTQSDSVQRLATIYQEELASHGIDMQIKLLDWSTYIERCRAHEFEMGAMSFQMEWDNDLTGIFHSRSIEGGQNFVSFRHDGADYILERARITLDDHERNELLQDLHTILHRQQPYTFLFSPISTSFVSRDFRGAVPTIKWFQERHIWQETDPSD
jgi:peptide/nickel transport system substrate-binding protein